MNNCHWFTVKAHYTHPIMTLLNVEKGVTTAGRYVRYTFPLGDGLFHPKKVY